MLASSCKQPRATRQHLLITPLVPLTGPSCKRPTPAHANIFLLTTSPLETTASCRMLPLASFIMLVPLGAAGIIRHPLGAPSLATGAFSAPHTASSTRHKSASVRKLLKKRLCCANRQSRPRPGGFESSSMGCRRLSQESPPPATIRHTSVGVLESRWAARVGPK